MFESTMRNKRNKKVQLERGYCVDGVPCGKYLPVVGTPGKENLECGGLKNPGYNHRRLRHISEVQTPFRPWPTHL